MFLDTQVSLASTHVKCNLHELGYNLHEPGYNLHEPGYNLHEPGYNLHCVDVSGPFQSVQRPQDVKYVLKAFIFQLFQSAFFQSVFFQRAFLEVYLAYLLSFTSLFKKNNCPG